MVPGWPFGLVFCFVFSLYQQDLLCVLRFRSLVVVHLFSCDFSLNSSVCISLRGLWFNQGGCDAATARGYGGSRGKPTCCCAEENVLFLPCNTHKSESILVHEVAHSVMNIGFDDGMMVRSTQFVYISTRRYVCLRCNAAGAPAGRDYSHIPAGQR